MKRYLILQDGTVFEGEAFGAAGPRMGELVFTTGMCGYIETLTDPSYYGQIVLQTFPLIGNYGIIPEDFEGKCAVRGYVVREWCREPSNFRAKGDLDAFLKSHDVPGICGLDTRELTRIIREHGVTNALLCDRMPEDLSPAGLSDLAAYTVKDAVVAVTAPAPRVLPAVGERRFRVALLDFGAKANIAASLCRRGCEVTLLPAGTSADEILSMGVDGVMLSNGPGDPAENTGIIREIAALFGRLPLFGICLGHQLMALAAGGRTLKLKYGHRGGNQPVRDTAGTRTYMTSQNHGYAVAGETLPHGRVRYINANDGTCEGVDYPEFRAFSVQFHPEARSGPQDTEFLFDRFCRLMEKGEM